MLTKLSNLYLSGRLSALAITLVASLGLTMGMIPAKAHAAWNDCSDLTVCFWVDINGGGARGFVTSTQSLCRVFVSPFVNSITAVWNRMIYPVRFYTWDDCFDSFGGYWYTVSVGQQINFLSWPDADNFESMKVNP